MSFKDIFNFIEGTTNKLLSEFDLLSPEIKELSMKRMEICISCPSLVKGKNSHCKECGCSFPGLTYSTKKKCPKGKW